METSPVQQPFTQAGQQQTLQNQQNTPDSPTEKSKQKMFIGLGIGLVIVIFVTGFFLMKGSSGQNNTTHVVTQTSTSQPTVAQNPQSTMTDVTNALPPGNGDSQLEQNLQSVDTSLGSADTNLGDADKGLNDQQTNLTE